MELQKVPTPQRNCSSTALNHESVDAPRLLIPMPRVHHHVADEAHVKGVGDALSKGLGVILRVCINRLSRLAAGNAGNGARNGARPPLSVKPRLCPAPLLTTEAVIALQSLPLRLMKTLYRNRKATSFVKWKNKVTKSDDSADSFNRSWTAEREFFDEKVNVSSLISSTHPRASDNA